jgi:hypothetical protein
MQAWLQQQLLHAVRPALRRAWILDEDVTSRIVCGTQEGAVVGYNGKKPGHHWRCTPMLSRICAWSWMCM